MVLVLVKRCSCLVNTRAGRACCVLQPKHKPLSMRTNCAVGTQHFNLQSFMLGGCGLCRCHHECAAYLAAAILLPRLCPAALQLLFKVLSADTRDAAHQPARGLDSFLPPHRGRSITEYQSSCIGMHRSHGLARRMAEIGSSLTAPKPGRPHR